MEFEWDPEKSASNAKKHGVSFEQARELFADPERIEVRLRYPDEPRYAVIGLMGNRHWTAIVTYREGRTRIISVRRSHKDEERAYDENL
ncbi:BrnT family toxin [Thermophilibacter sp.]